MITDVLAWAYTVTNWEDLYAAIQTNAWLPEKGQVKPYIFYTFTCLGLSAHAIEKYNTGEVAVQRKVPSRSLYKF